MLGDFVLWWKHKKQWDMKSRGEPLHLGSAMADRVNSHLVQKPEGRPQNPWINSSHSLTAHLRWEITVNRGFTYILHIGLMWFHLNYQSGSQRGSWEKSVDFLPMDPSSGEQCLYSRSAKVINPWKNANHPLSFSCIMNAALCKNPNHIWRFFFIFCEIPTLPLWKFSKSSEAVCIELLQHSDSQSNSIYGPNQKCIEIVPLISMGSESLPQ